jgi:small subunit ribosomal protein YMR-31
VKDSKKAARAASSNISYVSAPPPGQRSPTPPTTTLYTLTTMFRPTSRLLAQHRQPLIKFLGKRSMPKSLDHTPHPHPASEHSSLPDSFAESFAKYRSRAQQHGPLKTTQQQTSSSGQQQQTSMSRGVGGVGGPQTYGAIGGVSGASLGSVKPGQGEYFDRSELPKRFRRMTWSESEIEAVDSAGASMWN